MAGNFLPQQLGASLNHPRPGEPRPASRPSTPHPHPVGILLNHAHPPNLPYLFPGPAWPQISARQSSLRVPPASRGAIKNRWSH